MGIYLKFCFFAFVLAIGCEKSKQISGLAHLAPYCNDLDINQLFQKSSADLYCHLLSLYDERCFESFEKNDSKTNFFRFVLQEDRKQTFIARLEEKGDCVVLYLKVIPPQLFNLHYHYVFDKTVNYQFTRCPLSDKNWASIKPKIQMIDWQQQSDTSFTDKSLDLEWASEGRRFHVVKNSISIEAQKLIDEILALAYKGER
jgi:hypothetical protein